MIKYDFKNKLVLVTAASKGIGFAIASNFYKSGAMVAICSRNKETLDDAVKKISQEVGGRIEGYQCDLSQLDQLQQLIKDVEDTFSSSVDIFINNSGGPAPKSIIDTNMEDWEEAVKGNLLSSIALTKLIVEKMISKQWGRIIYLTSTLSREPAEGMVLSNVTRSGLAAFSKTLSREVGLHGITENTVLTGGCKTDRFYSLVENQIKDTGETMDEAVDRLSATIPVGHISTPEEFANTILFLASEESSYLNGVALPLDGGASKGYF
jgi:3-oxoacyl-[acyl-carrier protein] reductase